MATGGGPPDPSAPKGSTQSDREGEESAPTAPSLLCVLCARQLRDRHLLCCMHLNCKDCKGRVEEQDGRLKCPQCELSVLVNGCHVREIPFAVQLDAPILKNSCWATTRSVRAFGASKGSLQFPEHPYHLRFVAVSPVNGSVFVPGDSLIYVFDVERNHVRTFFHQILQPLGIDISANGQL